MNFSLNVYEVGFELEFCHDKTPKEIKDEIKSILEDGVGVFWVSRAKRQKSIKSQKFYRDYFTLYHDHTIDPDYENQENWEMVTPVWNFTTGNKCLYKLLSWIEYTGGTTNKTTGLHVNINAPYFQDTVDPIKLIKSVDESKWLKKFHRLHNQYVLPHDFNKTLNLAMRDKAISFRRKHYIEFRIIGGFNYHLKWDLINESMNHFIKCIDKCLVIK